MIYVIGEFFKYDSKLDFNLKSISKLKSNAKLTQKTSEIIIAPYDQTKSQKSFLRI